MTLPRPRHETQLRALLRSSPVVAILGARQVGKTTLARQIARSWPGGATFFDLEDPTDLARLHDPMVERLRARWDECYFWATHAGAEIDLLVVRGRTRLGFEIKRTTAPSVTLSMHVALGDLKLKRLDVIHAGAHTFPLAPRIRAVALERLLEDLDPLA